MIRVDGHPTDAVPADDRGLNYGDGLFETMRVEDGRIPLLELHLDRLEAGCRRLAIEPPGRDLLAGEAGAEAARAGGGLVKLVLTRGSGGRGYAPSPTARPRRVLSTHPLPAWPRSHYTRGVRIGFCETALPASPALGGLKHLGRLEQVLASRELAARDLDEGLMRDPAGHVVEATRANLFLVAEGRLLTPGIRWSGVEGIMRRAVMEAASADGLTVSVVEVVPDGIEGADELFLTGSVLGIWPVRELAGGRRWAPAPGPVTRRLMQRVAALGVPGWAP